MRPSSRTASSSSSSRVLRADAARTRGGVSRSSRPDGGVRVAGLALGNLSLLLLALLLALSALATTADATSGTYVDVTVSYTSQVAGRFGYQPTQRSGQSMVRARVRPSFGFWIPTRPAARLVSSRPLLLSSSSLLTLPRHDPRAALVRPQTRVDSTASVLFGGLAASGVLNDVWEYNHSTGFWTRLHAGGSTPADASAPTVPPPRVGHAAVVLQGDLWIFGGYDPDAGDMNDLWKFDRSEGTWSQAAPLGGGASATTWPATRSGASATASDPTSGTSFVLFGGNLKNDVWSYDVSTGAWSLLMNEVASTSDAAAAFARFSAAAAATLAAVSCAALLVA